MIFANFNEMPAQESNESSRCPSVSMEEGLHIDYYNEKVLPEPPYHVFSHKRKKRIVYIVSLAGLFSPLSSSIYFPALDQIANVSLFSSSFDRCLEKECIAMSRGLECLLRCICS